VHLLINHAAVVSGLRRVVTWPNIVVDGLRVEPKRLSKEQLAFALPPGAREIALRSNVLIPAHTVAESSDARELGICVGRLPSQRS